MSKKNGTQIAEVDDQLDREQRRIAFESGVHELVQKYGFAFMLDTYHRKIEERHEISPVLRVVEVDGWVAPQDVDVQQSVAEKVKDGE